MFLIVVLNFFQLNKYNKVKVFSPRYVAHDFRPNLGLYDLFRLGYNIDFSFVEPNEKKVVLKLKCNMISCSCVKFVLVFFGGYHKSCSYKKLV